MYSWYKNNFKRERERNKDREREREIDQPIRAISFQDTQSLPLRTAGKIRLESLTYLLLPFYVLVL
jgi:hypothetical protein